MLQNKSQTQVSISGLTYNALLQDLYSAIKDTEEFKNSFEDFNSNTAERLIAEMFVYVAEQLANRIDQVGNELFVDTASIQGLSRLLKLVGYRLDFPSAAQVKILASTIASYGEVLSMSIGIDPNGGQNDLLPTVDAFKSIALASNNNIHFEFIDYYFDEEDGRYEYNYTKPITFTTPEQYFTLSEGTTKYQEYTVRSISKDIITLTQSPVIKNSVTIYYKEKGEAGAIRKLKQVDNFFSREALTTTDGYYTIRNLGNGRCEIVLQPAQEDMGAELIIMYRIGGGSYGNIAINSIDNTERRKLANNSKFGSISYKNIEAGAGGVDELTDDEIRDSVTQEIRNSRIAVCEDDYEYLLPKADSKIKYIKCYGEKNQASESLAETYGYYVNPLNVFLLILKQDETFYDAFTDNQTQHQLLTDYINDIVFEILDLNPRFNERYQINKALINQEETDAVLAANYTDNTYRINLEEDAITALQDGNAKITITSVPYVETKDITKKGIDAFSSTNAIACIPWKGKNGVVGLLDLENAEVGDVYIISDEDPSRSRYRRYVCIKAVHEASSDTEFNLTKCTTYSKSIDEDIVPGKTYYYWDSASAMWRIVEEPKVEDLDKYYEKNSISVKYVPTLDAHVVPGKTYYIYDGGMWQVVENPVEEELTSYYEISDTIVVYTSLGVSEDKEFYDALFNHIPFAQCNIELVATYYERNNNYWADHWEAVEYKYLYNNFINEAHDDIMYIQQDALDISKFEPAYSYITRSFVGTPEAWDIVVRNTGGSNNRIYVTNDTTMNINGITIYLDNRYGTMGYYSKEEFAYAINSQITPTTQMVVLQDNITSEEGQGNKIPYDKIIRTDWNNNTTGITVKFGNEIQQLNMELQPNLTYGDVITTLNNVINNYSSTRGKFLVDLCESNNSCYKLVLIANVEFTAEENAADYLNSKSFVTDFLNNWSHIEHLEYWKEESVETEVDPNKDWDTYYFSHSQDLVYVDEDDNVVIGFLNGNDELNLSSTNLQLIYLFGFDDASAGTVHKVRDYRQFTIVISEDEHGAKSAMLEISMCSPSDLIKKTLYINIFGLKATSIELGSYYTDLQKWNPSLVTKDATTAALLKRDPLKNLYSTKYIIDEDGKEMRDIFGSEYELKFSAKRVTEKTFYQISSGDAPASVTSALAPGVTVKEFDKSLDYKFLMKVDTKQFDGATIKVITTGEVHEVKATEDGYAIIPLEWFVSCTVNDLIQAIVDTFTADNMVHPEIHETLLKKVSTADRLGFDTISADFASSIDFGETAPYLLAYFFNLSNNIVTSKEGQVDVTQIRNHTFPITTAFAAAQTINFNVHYKNASGTMVTNNFDVATGYALGDFAQNIANTPELCEHVVLDNNRIVFKDLNDQAFLQISSNYATQAGKLALEQMFLDKFEDSPLTGTFDTEINTDIEEGAIDVRTVLQNIFKVYSTSGTIVTIKFPWTIENKDFVKGIFSKNFTITSNELVLTIPFETLTQKNALLAIFNNTTAYFRISSGTSGSAVLTIPYHSEEQRDVYLSIISGSHFDINVSGSLTLTKTNIGDYYIETQVSEDPNTDEEVYKYIFHVEHEEAFPYGHVFFHMFEDYSHDHIVSTDENKISTFTDEFMWNEAIASKKVMLTSHIFQQPRFLPFDLKLVCYIPNRVGLNKTEEYKIQVVDYLRKEFGIYSDHIGDTILSDDIILLIRQAVPDIKKVFVEYMGYNISDVLTSTDSLVSDFNQKLIIAADQTDTVLTTDERGIAKSEEAFIHGLAVTVKYFE